MRINKIFNIILLGMISCWLVLQPLRQCAYASDNLSVFSSNQLIEYLIHEKIRLALAINATKTTALPKTHDEYNKQLQENTALGTLNKAKITNLEGFLANQKQLQQDFNRRLKYLQQTSLTAVPLNSQERISKIHTLNAVNKKTIELITENVTLAHRYQETLSLQKQNLDLWLAKEKMQIQLHKLRDKEDQFYAALERLYNHTITLQQYIKTDGTFPSTYLSEAKLLLNNQVINLTQAKIAEIELQKKLVKADYSLLKNPNIRTLQNITESYKAAITQLSAMEQTLKKMVTVLIEEQLHLPNEQLKQQFAALIRIVNAKIEELAIQQQTLQEDLDNHQEALNKQLSIRQSLTEYSLDSWPSIISQLTLIPSQFYNYLKSLALKVKDNYFWQDFFPTSLMWGLCFIILLSSYILRKLLQNLTQDKERSRLSGHLYDGVLILIHRNIPHLSVMAILVSVFYFNHILLVHYQLLLNLIFVWLIARVLILVARLILLERISDVSGKDVRLYYRIKWLFLTGGWATALMVISNLLPLSVVLQDIFNRLFMLFLLAVSIVAWRSKEVIMHLLEPFLEKQKKYFSNAVMLLMVLIPFTLFTTAIMGLIGYINLAWSMGRYEIQILLIMTGYVLIRGLLIDALDLVSEWMISSMNNGWLWVEVCLKPLDRSLRLSLIVFSGLILCKLLGVKSDSVLISKILLFAQYPLLNVSGIYITLLSIVEFFLLLAVFIWTAKWTREFGYRWLYRNARDAGIRNSLAVFTQYAVILIGGFIALHVLGFDFSGMSMVIGGLAVGMGFGLRDVASNIIGGLILLIERPVREGDLITLGEYEGRVSHIGIRSMRVLSWDNMEVLIPNAETFNKPFSNWTYQDSIVRTVVPIKVSRADDPVIVQQLLLDVLAIIHEIVPEPPPQVFLKQIDAALIEFEIRYFVNVQVHSLFEVRSKVLFAITEQFKAAGIQAPIPPIKVELKDSEEQHGSSNITTTIKDSLP